MYIKQGKMPIEQEQLEILFQVIIGTLVSTVKIKSRLGYKMADQEIEAPHVILSGFIT